MFSPDQYQLIDFGAGRKLERFGAIVLDRPAPAVLDALRQQPGAWPAADAAYDVMDEARRPDTRGQWRWRTQPVERWQIRHDRTIFELKPTDYGHLGVFPEQQANWDWISGQIAAISSAAGAPRSILNLFAYTGGSTLAAAAAGASVTHVDAAAGVVRWARQNAELSGLADAPIRWIVEDAAKFVAREVRRGNRYHAVLLDPPSYGHGPKGEPWKIDDALPDLLRNCWKLIEPAPQFLLLTCHSPSITADIARQMIADVARTDTTSIEAGEMFLATAAGRRLPSGAMARWAAP